MLALLGAYSRLAEAPLGYKERPDERAFPGLHVKLRRGQQVPCHQLWLQRSWGPRRPGCVVTDYNESDLLYEGSSDQSTLMQNKFCIPKSHSINSDPRVHRNCPLIFVWGVFYRLSGMLPGYVQALSELNVWFLAAACTCIYVYHIYIHTYIHTYIHRYAHVLTDV